MNNSTAIWSADAAQPPAITHAADAGEVMTFAAAELRRYLETILHTALPAAPGSSRIHLDIDEAQDLTDEGYVLYADGATFRITGGGEPGLLYGVYEFLRRYCGCRFSGLGPDGEWVPRADRISAPAAKLHRKPVLWYRGLQFYKFEDPELARLRLDWMAKNGLNYISFTPAHDDPNASNVVTVDPATGEEFRPAQDGIKGFSLAWFDQHLRPEARKRGLKLDMNHHNLLYWLPPHRYEAAHPEWYALTDGQRGANRYQLCLCTSNAAAMAELLRNVRAFLRANPDVKILGVIPEDYCGMCQCAACVAEDEHPTDAFHGPTSSHVDYQHAGAENRSKARRYARLLNLVADAIRDEFPGVLVGGAAYLDILWPPRDIELASNTTIWVALFWRDGARPIASSRTSELNRFYHDILRQWHEVYAGRLLVYEYYVGMEAQRSLPYPMTEVICRDWPELRAVGVEGATIQSWGANHHVYGLNLLAFARSGWDAAVDADAVLDEYLLGIYGGIAVHIRPIYAAMHQSVRALADCPAPAEIPSGILQPDGYNVAYFLRYVGHATLHRALDGAQRSAGTPREQRQVAALRQAVRYWEMAAEMASLQRRAQALQDEAPAAAASLLHEATAVRYPELMDYLETTLPRGWASIWTPRKWQGALRKMKQLTEELNATALTR